MATLIVGYLYSLIESQNESLRNMHILRCTHLAVMCLKRKLGITVTVTIWSASSMILAISLSLMPTTFCPFTCWRREGKEMEQCARLAKKVGESQNINHVVCRVSVAAQIFCGFALLDFSSFVPQEDCGRRACRSWQRRS